VAQGFTTTRILREIRELGYSGGRSILNELTARLRPETPRKSVKRRFETRPGEELQIDWSVYTVPIAGRPTRVHALVCVLAYSRRVHVRFYRNERQTTLFEGLVHAWNAFEGATQRAVVDNMATAVLGRVGPRRRVLWHPRLLELARHYGTGFYACRVRHPNRKGKDERVIFYLEVDFVRGSSFASFEELNRRVQQWCDEVANLRVHGTTGRVPMEAWREERPFLIRLPETRFAVHEDVIREVGPAATLSIAGTPYTVPAPLANRTVPVRMYAEHFEVLDGKGEVAFSRRYVEDALKGRLQIDPAHYSGLPRAHGHDSAVRLDELFRRRFPVLEPFLEGLVLRMKTLAPVHLSALLRLAATYGDERFLLAASRALQFRRFSAEAVRRILERNHPEVGEPDLRPLALDARALALGEDIEAGSLESYRGLEQASPRKKNAETNANQDAVDDTAADKGGA